MERARSGMSLILPEDEGAQKSNTFHDVLSFVSPSKRDRIAASLAEFGQVRRSAEVLHARFSSGRCVSLLLSNCTVVTVTLDADGIAVVDCRIHKGLPPLAWRGVVPNGRTHPFTAWCLC